MISRCDNAYITFEQGGRLTTAGVTRVYDYFYEKSKVLFSYFEIYLYIIIYIYIKQILKCWNFKIKVVNDQRI